MGIVNLQGITSDLRTALGIGFIFLAIMVVVSIKRTKPGQALLYFVMALIALGIASMSALASSDTAGLNLVTMFFPKLAG